MQVLKIKDVSHFYNGFAFKSKDYSETGDYIVRIGNVKESGIDLSNAKKIDISKQEKDLNNYLIKQNSLLLAMSGATTGKVSLYNLNQKAYLNQRVGMLVCKNNILPKYLYYFLINHSQKFLSSAIGAAVQNLSKSQIENTEILVPSLLEQKNIVERLDRLHQLVNRLSEIKNSELTKYDELFQSLLNDELNELTSNFPSIILKENTYIAGRIGWKGLSKKDYTEQGPLFINVSSLNDGQYVNFELSKHISKERYFESENIGLVEGDVLICKDGSIGKVGIVGELKELATVNSSLLIVRPLEGLLPKYLYYVFVSPQFQSIVHSRIEGSTVPHLYQRDIKNFSIPLPPIDIQQKIVYKFDLIYDSIKNIKNKISSIQDYNFDLLKSTLNNEFAHE